MPTDEEVQPQEEVQENLEGTEENSEETQEVEDLDEESIKEAKTLYKLLKDPSKSKDVLTAMAVTAGIITLNDAPTTPTEIREAKRDIKALVKEKLGKDFEFFAPKLSEVIEAVLEEARSETEDSTKDIRLQTIQSQVDNAAMRLNKETNGDYRKIENRVLELVKRYPQPDNTSIYDYLKEMYSMAGGKVNSASTRKIVDRIQQNAKDAPGRMRTSVANNGKEPPALQAGKKLGLKGAVEAALKSMES
jgi:hypothetical protein